MYISAMEILMYEHQKKYISIKININELFIIYHLTIIKYDQI